MSDPALEKSTSNTPGSPGRNTQQPQVRSRVSQACEVCRKRKVKCNGQEPCSYCLSSGKICTFKEVTDNAALSRQQANSVDVRLAKVEDTLRRMQPMSDAFEAWMSKNDGFTSELPFLIPRNAIDPEAGPSTRIYSTVTHPRKPYKPSPAIQRLSQNPTVQQSPQQQVLSPGTGAEANEEEGDERWSTRSSHLTKDSYGNLRFIGGTSSAVLVDALTTLQQEPTSDQSPESTFSAGKTSSVDLPLPFFNRGVKFRDQEALPRPEDIAYPPSEDADELVATYFTEIHHTFPILQQQTFLERYKKVMEAHAAGKPSREHAFLASVFAVWACGACLAARKKRTASSNGEEDAAQQLREFRGYGLYEKAQLMFWMGSGASHIEQVQCLALLAICNASWNTLAASWINAGQALRRAQDLGLHRLTRRSILSPLEKEIRRRVWWCVYGLDRALSITLGRPSGTHDDDCDVEMPLELDDTQLLQVVEGGAPVDNERGTSYMTGFVALLQIYMLAGRVMRFVHSPRLDNVRSEQAQEMLASFERELNDWSNNLPLSVRNATNDNNNPRLFTLCLIAYFVYYSAVINLHRPFIPEYAGSEHNVQSLGQCLHAACSCIKIGETTVGMLPTSHHLAFAVQYITLSGVILLRCLAYVMNEPGLVDSLLADAEKCIGILKGLEEAWPASRRCREIVTDLLTVVKARMNGGASTVEDQREAAKRQQQQKERENASKSPQAATDPTGVKRKRSVDQVGESISRPRLDENYSWQKTEGGELQYMSPSTERPEAANGGFQEPYPPSHQQRVSNLRTSMGSEGSSKPIVSPQQSQPQQYYPPQHGHAPQHPQSPQHVQPPRHPHPHLQQHHPEHRPAVRSSSLDHSSGHAMPMYSPTHQHPPHHHAAQAHTPHHQHHQPQHMAVPMMGGYAPAGPMQGPGSEGDLHLPFAEYNFLGDTFETLVGDVMRPPVPPEGHPDPGMLEENSAYLARAYNGVGVAQPFGVPGNVHGSHGGANGGPR